MKTMAWKLLSLLLFYSLAVVWADGSLPIPDYEDTLPLRESACWVSIKMEEKIVDDRGPPSTTFRKLLRKLDSIRKSWNLYWKGKPQDSGRLFFSDINETLLKEAGIKKFKWMPCFAKPSEAPDVSACQKKALAACSSKSFKNVMLIYGIQQWRKDDLHKSLEKLAELPESFQKQSKEGKITQVIKIALFIDCQYPTDMDMKENPTGCHGGRRLDFDPTFSKHFPRSQIEIRSEGEYCSAQEIYPGGLLAREKVEGSFLMTMDEGITADGVAGTGLMIKATNEGVVLLDSDFKGPQEENRECVLKNSTEEQRSLWIHRKTNEGIEETFEHKLEPNESVNVKLLPHTEIYPFLSLPELVAEEKNSSNYVLHLKLLAEEAREVGELVVRSETEHLRHENLNLMIMTCRGAANTFPLANCLDKAVDKINEARRVFVSSSSTRTLDEAISFLLAVGENGEKNWKADYERNLAKYKFIEVGGKLIPPRPLGWLERQKRRFLRFIGWMKKFANFDAESFTKGELHLDVALFHAYRPLHLPISAIQIGSNSDEIGCFNEINIQFFRRDYELYTTRKMGSFSGLEKLPFSDDAVQSSLTSNFYGVIYTQLLSNGRTETTILQNVSKLELIPRSSPANKGELNSKLELAPGYLPVKKDEQNAVWCNSWSTGEKNHYLEVISEHVYITFIGIGVRRSTAIFVSPPEQ